MPEACNSAGARRGLHVEPAVAHPPHLRAIEAQVLVHVHTQQALRAQKRSAVRQASGARVVLGRWRAEWQIVNRAAVVPHGDHIHGQRRCWPWNNHEMIFECAWASKYRTAPQPGPHGARCHRITRERDNRWRNGLPLVIGPRTYHPVKALARLVLVLHNVLVAASSLLPLWCRR